MIKVTYAVGAGHPDCIRFDELKEEVDFMNFIGFPLLKTPVLHKSVPYCSGVMTKEQIKDLVDFLNAYLQGDK